MNREHFFEALFGPLLSGYFVSEALLGPFLSEYFISKALLGPLQVESTTDLVGIGFTQVLVGTGCACSEEKCSLALSS